MSAITRTVLSPRAVGGPGPASPVFQYGRAAAYRRISSKILAQHSRSSLSSLQSATPSPLRSHFLPASILPLAFPPTSRRSISFKEMREAKAAESQKPKDRPRNTSPTSSPAADSAKAKAKAAPEPPQEEEVSEAEKVYEQARAESAKQDRARKQKAADEEEAGAEGEDQAKKEKAPPPPQHGNKSPWQVFTETLSSEFKASKEWNEGTQQLSGSIHDFTQNPNVQKAKSAYTKATDAATTNTSAALKSTASAIGSGAGWAWDTTVVRGVRKGVGAVGTGLEKATRPVRETEAYKNVKETIDDGSSSRYGGWTDKEERKKRREARELREGRRNAEPMEEDPEAGTNVTLHKDAKWKESWREFRDSSKLMQRVFSLKSSYAESENPLISTARSISDRVAGFFAENETAMVIKKFREMDPSFQLEPFLQELREYILPEVLDAYVKGDAETLKLWLSAAQYQVYAALMHQYTQHGLQSDGRILDIRNVDVLNARILDPGDVPVFVIMCRTQEVHVYRNKKTGQLASGMEDKVQQVTYAIGITRLSEDVSNPETRGWRLIELQKSAREYI